MHGAAHPAITAPPLAPTLAALGDDPRRSLDRLHDAKFRYVQLSAMQPGMRPRDLDRSARRDLLAAMRRRELEPSGIDLWIPPEHFVQPQHVDRAVAAMRAAIELAGDLGRIVVSVTLPPLHSADEETASTIIAAAQRHGVPLADHAVPISEREHNEILGIGVDPAAWLAVADDPPQIVSMNAASLMAARLCDLSTEGTRVPIGAAGGRLNVDAYKIALSVAGYERPIVLDARQWLNAWRGLAQSSAAWK